MDRDVINSPEYAAWREKAGREHLPMFGAFELTARCNLDCRMCYVHKTDPAVLKEELSTAEWKRIFDEAIAAGMKHALLTGGECLLRGDFEELYLYLYSRGIIMDVNTNGLLITEEKADFFAQYPPRQLQISLYGASDNGYERVTGHRVYDRVINTLDLLKSRGIKPRIALTVSRYLADDFISLLRLVKSRGLRHTATFDLSESREDRKYEDYALRTEEMIGLRQVSQVLLGKGLCTPRCPAPAPGGPGEPLYGMPCNAGNISFSVLWNGKMALCLTYPEICTDLRTQSFDACWRYIRERADAVVQSADCVNCAYRERCPHCPDHRYEDLYSGKCKASQCRETVACYEAGLFSLPEDEKKQGTAPEGADCVL